MIAAAVRADKFIKDVDNALGGLSTSSEQFKSFESFQLLNGRQAPGPDIIDITEARKQMKYALKLAAGVSANSAKVCCYKN